MVLADRWHIPSPCILKGMISYDTARLWLFYLDKINDELAQDTGDLMSPEMFVEHYGNT